MTSATGSRGFTLLELLVVLAIMVLLAGAWPLATPRLFPGQQLRNETQRLANVLRTARTLARVTGTVQLIEVPASGNTYRVGPDLHALPRGVTLHLRHDEAGMNSRELKFFPDGSSTGGTLELVLSDRSESIRIGRLTGRAEVTG